MGNNSIFSIGSEGVWAVMHDTIVVVSYPKSIDIALTQLPKIVTEAYMSRWSNGINKLNYNNTAQNFILTKFDADKLGY